MSVFRQVLKRLRLVSDEVEVVVDQPASDDDDATQNRLMTTTSDESEEEELSRSEATELFYETLAKATNHADIEDEKIFFVGVRNVITLNGRPGPLYNAIRLHFDELLPCSRTYMAGFNL